MPPESIATRFITVVRDEELVVEGRRLIVAKAYKACEVTTESGEVLFVQVYDAPEPEAT